MTMTKPSLLLLVLSAFTCATAAADEWKADRLRGTVMAFADGDWHRVRRGDIVDDSRKIRTSAGAHVTFVRDRESIEIDGASEVRIFDKAGQHMTTVVQNYGSVTIDAEHRNIQHFSVQTPFLAAVVKGTRFTVSSDKVGSNVAVSRGMVQVQDTVHSLVTNVPAGLNATVAPKVALEVEGSDQKLVVATMEGIVLPPASVAAIQAAAAQGETVNASTLPAIIAASPAPSAAAGAAASTPVAPSSPALRADTIPLSAASQANVAAAVSLGSAPSSSGPGSSPATPPGTGRGGPGNNAGPGPAGPGAAGPGPAGNGPGNGNGPGANPGIGIAPGGPANNSGPGNGNGPANSNSGPGNNNGNGPGPAAPLGVSDGRGPRDAAKDLKDAAKDLKDAVKDAAKDAKDLLKGSWGGLGFGPGHN